MPTRARSGRDPQQKAGAVAKGAGAKAPRSAKQAKAGKAGTRAKTASGKPAVDKSRKTPVVESSVAQVPSPRESPPLVEVLAPVEAAEIASLLAPMPGSDQTRPSESVMVENEPPGTACPPRESELQVVPSTDAAVPVPLPAEAEAALPASATQDFPTAPETPSAFPQVCASNAPVAPSERDHSQAPHPVVAFLATVMEAFIGQDGPCPDIEVDSELTDFPLEKLQYFGQALHLLAMAVDRPDLLRPGASRKEAPPLLRIRLEQRPAGRVALRCYDNGRYFERVLPKPHLGMEALRPLVLGVVKAKGSICLRRGRGVEFEIIG
jgi:hypothetical protein